MSVVKCLQQHGAEGHVEDGGNLVPLHDACFYGLCEVAEVFAGYGAVIDVADFWKFDPLPKAALLTS